MKQKIYEIPIWDSFKTENCECPLCAIEKKVEQDYIAALFTEMVMDVRLNPQLVEDFDFCKDHFEKLYRYPDKCGLAVLAARILYSRKQKLAKYTDDSHKADKPFLKGKFFTKRNITARNLKTDKNKKCLICQKLNIDMENYVETLINLWHRDTNFKSLYSNSGGFCFKHLTQLLDVGSLSKASDSKKRDFSNATMALEKENLERLNEEIEWFISKFDYRYANEPWKSSKDSLIRTIQKLVGNYNHET